MKCHSLTLFSNINFKQTIVFLCSIIYSISITSDLQIISLPYLSINKDSEDEHIRKLSEQYVYGSSFKLNYYYTNLYLGKNKKKQGYILDTGSSITTSTCQLCSHCGKHINPYFAINKEKDILACKDEKCSMVKNSCKNNKCSFFISYSEGSSLDGVYVNQLVRFGEDYLKKSGTYVPIGCTKQENHLFYKQDADGIMGLVNDKYNFINILHKLGAINHFLFSICFARLGGYFAIDEIREKNHKEKVTFVPMLIDREKYFSVKIKGISVNGQELTKYKENEYTNFLDSGTTIAYLPVELYNEIRKITDDSCKNNNNKCGEYFFDKDLGPCYKFNSTEELISAIKYYWPTIIFHLDGYEYKWTPDKYFFNNTSKNKTSGCMGMNSSGLKRLTLGGTWFIGHDVIFDKENNLIGFAEANCYQNKRINLENGLELNNTQKDYFNFRSEDFLDMSIIETTNIYVVLGLFIFFGLFCSIIACCKYFRIFQFKKKGEEKNTFNSVNENESHNSQIGNKITDSAYSTLPVHI